MSRAGDGRPTRPPSGGATGEVTALLHAWGAGDAAALDALLPLVYAELRRLARHYLRGERAGHTLEPTALVHEAYLRLAGTNRLDWQNRAHFIGVAAETMRRVLVDHARRRLAARRGGGVTVVGLDAARDAAVARPLDVVALDDALRDLERLDPRQSRIVVLRYFGGLEIAEVAAVLELSPATVKRDWAWARIWLYQRLAAPGVE